MDTSLIKPYVDALTAQKTQLDGYLTRGFQAIAIPTSHEDIPEDKKDFLTKSGNWFLVLGIVGLIAGFAVSSTGIIVAGCAAVMSGVYCYLKGKQALRHQAYDRLGQSVYTQISSVADNVAAEWTKFMTAQNDALKKVVVASTESPDTKVALIDKIDSTPAVKVDLSDVRARLADISEKENLSQYAEYLPTAADAIRKAINDADGAQQGIYSTLAK